MGATKHKDERREEFIQTALNVFSEKGYEAASINDILKKMAITKGSFYHNFESKEDLLNQIIDYMASEIQEITMKVVEDEALSPLDKLRWLSKEMMAFRHKNQEVYRAMAAFQKDDKNILMAKMYMDRVTRLTLPGIIRVFEEGRDQGIFSIQNIQIAAETYMSILILYKQSIAKNLLNYESNEDSKSALVAIENIYKDMIAGILGVDSNEIDYLSVREELR